MSQIRIASPVFDTSGPLPHNPALISRRDEVVQASCAQMQGSTTRPRLDEGWQLSDHLYQRKQATPKTFDGGGGTEDDWK